MCREQGKQADLEEAMRESEGVALGFAQRQLRTRRKQILTLKKMQVRQAPVGSDFC